MVALNYPKTFRIRQKIGLGRSEAHNKSGHHLLRRNRVTPVLIVWNSHDTVDKNFVSQPDTTMFNARMFFMTKTKNRPDLPSGLMERHHCIAIKFFILCVRQGRLLHATISTRVERRKWTMCASRKDNLSGPETIRLRWIRHLRE